MRVYTIHLRWPVRDPDRDVVLVREGFCWPAFVVPVLWALWNRLWLVAVGVVLLHGAVGVAVQALGLDPFAAAAVTLGVALIIGFTAYDLQRWSLSLQGYRAASIVAAADRDHAEYAFYTHRPDVAAGLRP